ncbi:MAG TPA: hypothetical protein VKU01_13515 [Bryobacteraceae bacterium]|nr:hypothetical protein [Bryobacteraceae bacterium]
MGLFAENASDERVRVERVPVLGGGELITLICQLPQDAASGKAGQDFPLISILRDTMGDADPSNDALRSVWVLSYARPSIFQRIAGTLPFLYMRAGSSQRHDHGVPVPIFDMGAAGRRTFPKVTRAVLQSEMLDTIGIPVRASTRAYSGNATDFRNQHVWQALNVLSSTSPNDELSASDLERLQARLLLSTRMLGDLVSESYLSAAFNKENTARMETRGHNWELLRQKAEEDGLYFQPLSVGFNKSAHALLWIESHHYDRDMPFNGQFLSIANPFEGNWLEKWKGYKETWYLDANGARVDADIPGARPVEMVPVALYSLDHPRTPLLLVDFRRPSMPKRREMMRRAVDQVTVGVLGLTGFGNWPFLAGNTAWRFVRTRWGAAMDRTARERAYAQLDHSLFLDESLNPALRRELQRRVDGFAMNPMDNGMAVEARIAREQYAALVAFAGRPGGLEKTLARDRSMEIAPEVHSKGSRAMFELAHVATFGRYQHTDRMNTELLAEVDRERRFAWHKRFLEDVLDSTPRAEVAFDMGQVQKSLDAITEIGGENPNLREESEQLVRRVLAQTSDAMTRQRCLECLQRLAKLPVVSTPAAAVSADNGAQ